MTTETLSLDEQSLDPSLLSIPTLMRELNLQNKPSWILVKLMNALEKQRQAKGMGWSRAWNKYGMTTFRTHIHFTEQDSSYFQSVRSLLNHFLSDCPAAYGQFVQELLDDPGRMAFTFYHNNEGKDGSQFEGLTLSLGRKVASDPSKRDRLDLILEDRREEGRVDGMVDRIRIYVCPWNSYQNDKTHFLYEQTDLPAADLEIVQPFFQASLCHYHNWKHEKERQWSHWSARYIDYFGPRTFIPQNSSFT